MAMTEEEKIQLLGAITKGAHIEQVNVGDGYQNCTIVLPPKDANDNVSAAEEAGVVTFEEAFRDYSYLVDKTMMKAWNGLRDAGYLLDDYRLAPDTSRSVEKCIIEYFNIEAQQRGARKKGQTRWAPFEKFWEISNIKSDKGNCPKEHKQKILNIFDTL